MFGKLSRGGCSGLSLWIAPPLNEYLAHRFRCYHVSYPPVHTFCHPHTTNIFTLLQGMCCWRCFLLLWIIILAAPLPPPLHALWYDGCLWLNKAREHFTFFHAKRRLILSSSVSQNSFSSYQKLRALYVCQPIPLHLDTVMQCMTCS